MASVYGISSGSDNFSNSLLGIGKSSDTASNTSAAGSLMGMTTGSVSDLELIKNGSYKKLLNAYYKNQKSNTASTKEEKMEKINLTKANQSASSLSEAVGKLMKTDITEENREQLKENLKSVIDKYNALITDGSEVNNVSVLRQTLWMTQDSSALAASLSDVGITIGDGNKLSLDEDKFDTARLTSMNTIFTGKDSFMGKLAGRAGVIANTSRNVISGTGKASTYKPNATYESSDTGHIVDSET